MTSIFIVFIYYFLDDKIYGWPKKPSLLWKTNLQEVVKTLCQVAPDAGRPPPEVGTQDVPWKTRKVGPCFSRRHSFVWKGVSLWQAENHFFEKEYTVFQTFMTLGSSRSCSVFFCCSFLHQKCIYLQSFGKMCCLKRRNWREWMVVIHIDVLFILDDSLAWPKWYEMMNLMNPIQVQSYDFRLF